MKCRNTGFCVLSSYEANSNSSELKHEGTFKLLEIVDSHGNAKSLVSDVAHATLFAFHLVVLL